MGFYMLIFLGGLQDIPREYYEAARIDGAGPVQSFFKITLPLLQPTSFFVLLVSTVAAVCGSQTFDLIYVMTQGRPGELDVARDLLHLPAGVPVQRIRLCGRDGLGARRRADGDHRADVHADARRTLHLWLTRLRPRTRLTTPSCAGWSSPCSSRSISQDRSSL